MSTTHTTPVVDAIIKRSYETGVPNAIIREMIQTQTGREFSATRVCQRAKQLGISRIMVAAKTHGAIVDSHRDVGRPVVAPFDLVARWAKVWNAPFSSWDDLPVVNNYAFRRGHRGFQRELPVHRAMARMEARV